MPNLQRVLVVGGILFSVLFFGITILFIRKTQNYSSAIQVGNCTYSVSSQSKQYPIRPYDSLKMKSFFSQFNLCEKHGEIKIILTDNPQQLSAVGVILQDNRTKVDIASVTVSKDLKREKTIIELYINPSANTMLETSDSSVVSLTLISAFIRFPLYDKSLWSDTQPIINDLLKTFPSLEETGFTLR